jgi:hypothetical protein
VEDRADQARTGSRLSDGSAAGGRESPGILHSICHCFIVSLISYNQAIIACVCSLDQCILGRVSTQDLRLPAASGLLCFFVLMHALCVALYFFNSKYDNAPWRGGRRSLE